VSTKDSSGVITEKGFVHIYKELIDDSFYIETEKSSLKLPKDIGELLGAAIREQMNFKKLKGDSMKCKKCNQKMIFAGLDKITRGCLNNFNGVEILCHEEVNVATWYCEKCNTVKVKEANKE